MIPASDLLCRHGFSRRVIEPWGSGSNRILLVGEAPGEWEDRTGLPFHPQAPAGSVLHRLIKRAGYQAESFRIVNACWQRPPRNWLEGAPWEGDALDEWREPLRQVIEQMQPRVIVTLGNVALKALTEYGSEGTTVTSVQGYVLDGPYGAWIVPMLHPSYILQGQQAKSGCLVWAFQRAMQLVREGFERKRVDYLCDPSLGQLLEWERGYDPARHALSYDIETVESSNLDEEAIEDEGEAVSYQIVRVSLCYEGARATSFPWQAPYIDVARRMLASGGPKRVWNGNFDNPRLAAAGAPVAGRIYDVMWGWKHLQPTLPRSLGFVTPFFGWTGLPWKHLSGSDPAFYSAADAHALQQNGDGVEQAMRQRGQWERYERHTVDCLAVLERMAKNGLPYSREKAGEFERELQGKWDERYEELQRRVPDQLKPSKQKSGLKKTPKDVTGLVERQFEVLGSELTEAEADDNLCDPFATTVVVRWCKLEPFLPTSPKQMNELIRHYGHSPGRNRKTKKDTVDDETLRKLLKKCRNSRKPRDRELGELLQMARECRQLSKVLGTYVKGWRPAADGRIHSTPGFWGKMFRISWRRPNIAATIADKQEEYIAAGFRGCVAPAAGRVLVEADWKGIEAVLVGWFAGDEDYMRLARLGVHDYMGIHMAGGTVDLAQSDSDLKQLFRQFKREHPKLRDDAKHTVHGTNYGMGPHLMADLYEMPLAEAKRLQALYFELFPKIRQWQTSVVERAAREARLVNPFGYSMPFWEVQRWDSRKQGWVLGEDAKSAISFLPRDTAAAMLKEVLLRLAWLAEEGTLLSSTHDSLLCECDRARQDDVARLLVREMESPVPELGGLSVGVEVKAGPAWSDEMQVMELKEACAAAD